MPSYPNMRRMNPYDREDTFWETIEGYLRAGHYRRSIVGTNKTHKLALSLVSMSSFLVVLKFALGKASSEDSAHCSGICLPSQ